MVETAGAIWPRNAAGIRRRDRVPASPRAPPGLSQSTRRGSRRGRGVVRPEELERVDDRQVLHVQDGAPVVHLEVDRALADVERPEQSRRQDAAVEIVHLRPRTGVEEVDSDEGERSSVRDASTTYWPSKARMSVSRLYVLPSLPRALPTWKATALDPLKSVAVIGSTSKPPSVPPVKGSVIEGSPGTKTWRTPNGGPTSKAPPGMGFGAGNTAPVMALEDAAEVDEGQRELREPCAGNGPGGSEHEPSAIQGSVFRIGHGRSFHLAA